MFNAFMPSWIISTILHPRIERRIRILKHELKFGTHFAQPFAFQPDQFNSPVLYTTSAYGNELQNALAYGCFAAARLSYKRQRPALAKG